ncbi:hypothetical protein YN1_3690 [Nanoarchaeota archaeon]
MILKKHKTHNLKFLLLEYIKIDKDFEKLENLNLDKLSNYSILTRYDISTTENLTEEDAKEAIDIAENIREFILNKLNIQYPFP